MSYIHIEDLYKRRDILLFKQVYALEKIHGTSAHITFAADGLHFFAGGVPRGQFIKLFDAAALDAAFRSLSATGVTVYGEAYGGKCQGMSQVYGPALRFVAFEVKINDHWLAVPQAEAVARGLGLDFVDYALVPAELDALDAHRALPSAQALRLGMGTQKREGDVLRSPVEVCTNDGRRIIAKYKNEDFQETRSPRPVDAAGLTVLNDADAIAQEWVTPMRLAHVLAGLAATSMDDTSDVIRAMLADIEREAAGEVVWSKDVYKAVGKATANLWKQHLVW